MCPLSILIFFFFFFLGPFGVPLGLLAHLIKNSPKFVQNNLFSTPIDTRVLPGRVLRTTGIPAGGVHVIRNTCSILLYD